MLALESYKLSSYLQELQVCVQVAYGATEGYGKEKEGFWNGFDRFLDSIGIGYRLCLLGI